MYSKLPGLVLGFHGCDRFVSDAVLFHGKGLFPSKNDYDWLGHGVYFWENSPLRAVEYAEALRDSPRRHRAGVKTPAVLGAVIDLGYCLNLLDYRFLPLLNRAYSDLQNACQATGTPLPRNAHPKDGIPLVRRLDCAVVEMLHTLLLRDKGEPPFDSVRAAFWEGEPVYPGSGFATKNHIQVCVRNPNCIKGYFQPRELDPGFPNP